MGSAELGVGRHGRRRTVRSTVFSWGGEWVYFSGVHSGLDERGRGLEVCVIRSWGS